MRWPSLRDVSRKTAVSALRFPLTYISVVSCFGLALWMTHTSARDNALFARLLFVGVLGIPLFIGTRLLSESRFTLVRRSYIPIYSVAAVVLVLFYFSYAEDTLMYFFRFWQLMLAAHLLVALSGAAPQSKDGVFWRFNAHLFARACTTVLFSWTLFLGLAFALWAVDKLLGVKIHHKAYTDLGIFIAFIYSAWFFLIGLPQNLSVYEEETAYPGGLRVFAQFVLMPLVIIYLIIFYLYVGKICIQWAWPEGRIGYLVCGVATVGIFTHLLLDPLRNDERHPAVEVYVRWYYRVLFPLAILLAMAASRRVAEYGLTEKRYFLYVIAVWITGLSVYFGWLNRRNLKVIPFSMFVLAVMTIAGPWSAYSVSKWNQTGRLGALLEKNGLLKEGKVQKATSEVSIEDRGKISRTLDYLTRMHGANGVKPYFEADKKPSAAVLMKDQLGLDYIVYQRRYDDGPLGEENVYVNGKMSDAINIEGYSGLHQFYLYPGDRQGRRFTHAGVDYTLAYSSAASSLELKAKDELLVTVPLAPVAERALQYLKDGNLASYSEVPGEVVSVETDAPKMKVKVIIQNMGMKRSGHAVQIQNANGYLLLKPK